MYLWQSDVAAILSWDEEAAGLGESNLPCFFSFEGKRRRGSLD